MMLDDDDADENVDGDGGSFCVVRFEGCVDSPRQAICCSGLVAGRRWRRRFIPFCCSLLLLLLSLSLSFRFRCRRRFTRSLSSIVLRRGGVRTTGDEELSAHGRGDFVIVAGELLGACRSSRPDNSYTTVVAGRTALRVSTLTYREYPYLKPSPPCEIVKNRALWLRQEALGSRLFPFVIFEQVAMTT